MWNSRKNAHVQLLDSSAERPWLNLKKPVTSAHSRNPKERALSLFLTCELSFISSSLNKFSKGERWLFIFQLLENAQEKYAHLSLSAGMVNGYPVQFPDQNVSHCFVYDPSPTEWLQKVELRRLNYSVFSLEDAFLISPTHLPKSILNSSIFVVQPDVFTQ